MTTAGILWGSATAIVCLVSACPADGLSDARQEPEQPVDALDAVYAVHRETFELINQSTNLLGWGDPNPVGVVRAVNHLHSLGHAGAIKALRAYISYASDDNSGLEPNSPDQNRLCWIIPLLFIPLDKDAELPSLGRGGEADKSHKWEPFYITVIDDLPFHDTGFAGRLGTPDPDRGYLVEWAAQHGRLREKPFRPEDNPLKAADELCEKLFRDTKTRSDGTKYNPKYRHIRQQAWRTIAHLLPSERNKSWPGWLEDEEWNRLKQQIAKLKIRWSEQQQNYVAE
jgi:hypothetical protein